MSGFGKLGSLIVSVAALSACSEALYPPRPPQVPGPALADPPSSRVTLHISLTEGGLKELLEATVPKSGETTFTLIGERKLTWTRSPIELWFDNAQGKLGVKASIQGTANLPATSATFTLTMSASAQPVLAADYKAQLQSPQVSVVSDERLLRAAEWGAGALSSIREQIERQLRELRIDLKPMIGQSYLKLAQPFSFPVGDAKACVKLGLQTIEAGPTVFAGGIEKDIGAVVAPSVTMPCSSEAGIAGGAQVLPPLHNVASLPSGPFEVVVPVAATYAELQKAMTQAFTGGKLFFSKEFPDLYLEKPELYASGGAIVTKVHINGFAKKGGFKIPLEGDLYMHGHPTVRDNELEVPDLEPTIETKNALLKLKMALDAESIKREVRQSLRLDIGARIQSVRQKLSKELTFRQAMSGGPEGCVKADVGRIEVNGVYAHDAYLRLYVRVQAQAGAYLPCPK